MKCNFDRMNWINRIEERQGSNGLAGNLSCKSCSSSTFLPGNLAAQINSLSDGIS
jgi:hypothetical protein